MTVGCQCTQAVQPVFLAGGKTQREHSQWIQANLPGYQMGQTGKQCCTWRERTLRGPKTEGHAKSQRPEKRSPQVFPPASLDEQRRRQGEIVTALI